MLSHEGKDRSFSENAAVAVALSGVAGAVNATGFFAVGTYTSHVTGNLARVGDELAQGHFGTARDFFVLVLCFLSGAMVATAFVEASRRVFGRAHYTAPLLLETGLLAAVAGASALGVTVDPLAHLILTGTLCFSMGLQNALVTKISGAVVRTTHLTGLTTDFGIEVVRLLFWFGEKFRGTGLLGRIRGIRLALKDPELHKAWLHFAIFMSFFTGAIGGPVLYVRHGVAAMALPCVGLLALVATDQARRRIRRPAPLVGDRSPASP